MFQPLDLNNMDEFTPKPRQFKTYADLVEESEIIKSYSHDKDTLTEFDRDEIKGLVQKVLSMADNPDHFVTKVTTLVNMILLGANRENVQILNKVKALRAELKRQMYELVGANTGYYKNDYMVFMTCKNDSIMGPVLTGIENQIERLTDFINN